MALTPLHLFNQVATCLSNFKLLLELGSLLHPLHLLFVAGFLALSLFPLLVRYLSHHFHVIFRLLAVLLIQLLFVLVHLLVNDFFSLFDQGHLQPLLKSIVSLLLLSHLNEALLLPLPHLLLLFQSLLHELPLLPLVHSSSSLLVPLVLLSLLLAKFLVQVSFSLVDQHFPE